MSKLYDFLYADTGVVKNKENCHDARKLERYSETVLMTSLPLLNSLKLNLKNIKTLHKMLFKCVQTKAYGVNNCFVFRDMFVLSLYFVNLTNAV